MKLSQVSAALATRLVNNGTDPEINGVAAIEEAAPGKLTFVANQKYAAAAKTTKASAVIVSEDFPAIAAPTLRTRNPYLAFARAIELFYKPPAYPPGVHPTAAIHSDARIGKNASVGAYVVIDQDVEIGDNCVLLPHVVIYRGARIGNNFFAHAHAVVREYCRVGDDVTLQNGAIIGADGFGFAKEDDGRWRKITQSGITVLEDDVEVQANSCVDRASLGETRIGRNTKIDNLVEVAHNCRVGERSMLCAQAGLAGSTTLGRDVILAGQVGVAGHCTLGDGVVATAQSGIPNDVPSGKVVSGYPAVENKQWLRCVAIFNRLPELARAIRARGMTQQTSE
jgi:UDP-3-O-[3-hydroxymyristoyl] glucosamine N-acyltransferase